MKKNKLLFVVLGVLLLWWLFKGGGISALKTLTGGNPYPDDQNASQHFTWDEILTEYSSTYSDLSSDEIANIAAIAQLMEIIRTQNGQLPLVGHVLADGSSGVYSFTVTPDVAEKQAGLLTAVQDVQANFAGQGGSVGTATTYGTGVKVTGDIGALKTALAAGVGQ